MADKMRREVARKQCFKTVKPLRFHARKILTPFPLIMLAGCSFAPEHSIVDMPVPRAFPLQDHQSAEAVKTTAARIEWQQFFTDPQLHKLIAEALVYNRDVQIAAGRVAEARGLYQIQGSALYPQVNGVVRGTRARAPADLSVTGGAVTGSEYSSALSAGWEIDFWGRLQNLRAAALSQYLATVEARRAVATSLIAQVANSYLIAGEYEERIALATRSVETREESLRILRRRYEVGSGSKLEMTQAQTLLAQARTANAALQLERDVNLNALALLVGHPVDMTTKDIRLTNPLGEANVPVGLSSDLLVWRPDIIAAEYRLRAANANIGAARAAFFPNISLTGSVGTASAELDGLFKGGSLSWSFAPSISLPLFNGGRNKANLDLSRARKVVAIADYERTIQQAFRDVSDAMVQRRQFAAQIVTMQDMLDALTERARLADMLFTNGRSTYLEVLDAQRDLFDTEQRLVQLRRAHYASGVALYTALGGGFAGQFPLANETVTNMEVAQ